MRREKVIRYNFSQIPTFLRASISSVYAISIEAVEIAKITLVGSKQVDTYGFCRCESGKAELPEGAGSVYSTFSSKLIRPFSQLAP